MAPPSAVWQYFSRRGKNVVCGKCSKSLAFCGSTSTLFHHLRQVHGLQLNKLPASGSSYSREDEEAEIQAVESEEALTSSQLEPPPMKRVAASYSRGALDKAFEKANMFSRGGSRDGECTEALLYMIAVDKMPLRTTERAGFRLFCKKLQPLYRLPSEPTITKKLSEKYLEVRDKIKQEIHDADCISMAADIWTTAHTMASHLGVTVTLLKGVQMLTVELTAKPLTERKTEGYIRQVLINICEEWGIDISNVRGIVTDGGANIRAAVKALFGAQKCFSCFAHTLNLVAMKSISLYPSKNLPSEQEDTSPSDSRTRGVFDLPEFESDIEDDDNSVDAEETAVVKTLPVLLQTVKRTVRFFKKSEVASMELKRLQMEEMGKPEGECLRLIQSVITRWNSTYEMLDRYLQLSDLVNRVLLKVQREKSSKAKPPNIVNGTDIEALSEVRDLLKPLWQATVEICAEKNVTISKVIPLAYGMIQKITNFMATTPVAFNLQEKLRSELKSSFGHVEFVKLYGAATLLDPRFKKVPFKNLLACTNAQSYVADLVRAKINNRPEIDATMITAASPTKTGDDDLWSSLDEEVRSNRASGADDDTAGGMPIELRQYLNRPCCDRKLVPNPLEEWESLKGTYPHVYQVAREVLPILATSVPAERLFSHAGLIFSKLRTRLLGKRLDQLVLLQSVGEDLWFAK